MKALKSPFEYQLTFFTGGFEIVTLGSQVGLLQEDLKFSEAAMIILTL